MKLLLPILLLVIGLVIAGGLYKLRPEAEQTTPQRPIAQVETIEVRFAPHTIVISSQGNVLPKTETELSAETSGRIIEVSENFVAGGRVQAGEVLLKIDPADYEAATTARAAELATAYLNFAQEKALSEQALADWEAMGTGEPSELTLRKPQVEQAKAQIESAEAALRQAKRDLDRTTVTAPYSGKILEKYVDLGQYLTGAPATPIARIFTETELEVRLPLTEQEADFIVINAEDPSPVSLRPTISTSSKQWIAHLTRIEATIDPRSRLLYGVAELVGSAGSDTGMTDLPRRGLFVEAEIEGRVLDSVFALPRSALRASDTVYVVTPENTLKRKAVTAVRKDDALALIAEGLIEGEHIVTSPIAYFVEDMPVEIISTQ